MREYRVGIVGLGWVAGAHLLTEKNFRKIAGYEHLWTLPGALGRTKKSVTRKKKFA